MKRSGDKTLLSFFTKVKKDVETRIPGGETPTPVDRSCSSSSDQHELIITDSVQCSPHDIGLAVTKSLTDEQKLRFLNETWEPSNDFKFPFQKEGKQQRKFNREWLNQYNWLSYSKVFNGGFCKMCVLFAPTGAGSGSQALKTLVKEPLLKFKKATEDLRHHESTHYHKFSMEKAFKFKNTMESVDKKDIASILDEKKSSIIESNRKRLRPIIQTVVFCARNNIPLRGHRDDGFRDLAVEDVESGKHGVFNSLLAFRIDAGDEDLRIHLNTCGRNNTMISKTVQNEIIECIGDSIRDKIASDIKKAKFFAILCDETTDASTKELMSCSIRYVNIDTYHTQEEFVGFSELKSATGISIKQAIENELESLGLSFEYLCGQGYDGGSNMSGKFKGVQALILSQQPLAIYTHCFSHSLNLCISKSCELPHIRNMMGTVGTICVFLSASANRANALKTKISDCNLSDTRKTRLKAMCPTRWVERHDTLLTFKELFLPIVTLLDDMATSTEFDSDASTKACMYSAAMKKGDFIVALEITAYCLSLTLKLSEALQSPNKDLSSSTRNVRDVLEVFRNLRREAEIEFGSIFDDCVKTAENIGSEILLPRTCSKQIARANVPASNPEEYHRRVTFLPLVDHFISELESRFSREFDGILPLEGLIPAMRAMYRQDEILKAAEKYEHFLSGSFLQLKAEVNLWLSKWNRETKMPQTAIESLKECDMFFYPNVAVLLQIFATIPVTTSTAERSFSSLRRLKSYLRTTMSDTRLNGLALAHIHKDRKIDVDEIINNFSIKKQRRMAMTNWGGED